MIERMHDAAIDAAANGKSERAIAFQDAIQMIRNARIIAFDSRRAKRGGRK
jgi:hypothetical protein